MEFDSKVDYGGLEMEFGAPENNINMFTILRDFAICVWVGEEDGLSFFFFGRGRRIFEGGRS